jgi:hypothetical protein
MHSSIRRSVSFVLAATVMPAIMMAAIMMAAAASSAAAFGGDDDDLVDHVSNIPRQNRVIMDVESIAAHIDGKYWSRCSEGR